MSLAPWGARLLHSLGCRQAIVWEAQHGIITGLKSQQGTQWSGVAYMDSPMLGLILKPSGRALPLRAASSAVLRSHPAQHRHQHA
jgi:hypothetical protein